MNSNIMERGVGTNGKSITHFLTLMDMHNEVSGLYVLTKDSQYRGQQQNGWTAHALRVCAPY